MFIFVSWVVSLLFAHALAVTLLRPVSVVVHGLVDSNATLSLTVAVALNSRAGVLFPGEAAIALAVTAAEPMQSSTSLVRLGARLAVTPPPVFPDLDVAGNQFNGSAAWATVPGASLACTTAAAPLLLAGATPDIVIQCRRAYFLFIYFFIVAREAPYFFFPFARAACVVCDTSAGDYFVNVSVPVLSSLAGAASAATFLCFAGNRFLPVAACVPTTVECAPGTFFARAASPTTDRVCRPCAAGSFSAAANQLECVILSTCPASQVVSVLATPSSDRTCTACAGETFTNTSNAAACLPRQNCRPGTVQTAAGSFTEDRTCTPCADGWFSTATNALQCQAQPPCAPGTYAVVPASSSSMRQCAACEGGQFSVAENATVCTAWRDCAPETFVAVAGSATADRQCEPCPPGFLSTTVNAAQCRLRPACPAGTFINASVVCEACSAGTFTATVNTTTACAPWRVCGSGSTELREPTATSDRLCTAPLPPASDNNSAGSRSGDGGGGTGAVVGAAAAGGAVGLLLIALVVVVLVARRRRRRAAAETRRKLAVTADPSSRAQGSGSFLAKNPLFDASTTGDASGYPLSAVSPYENAPMGNVSVGEWAESHETATTGNTYTNDGFGWDGAPDNHLYNHLNGAARPGSLHLQQFRDGAVVRHTLSSGTYSTLILQSDADADVPESLYNSLHRPDEA